MHLVPRQAGGRPPWIRVLPLRGLLASLILVLAVAAGSPARGQEPSDTPGSGAAPPAGDGAGRASPPPAGHVVLISIDGLRPEFYLDRDWPAPNLQEMAREGAHAEAVRGVFPSVTYPSHTTIITGALPARHGVPYNTLFEPGGETGRWYWYADSIRVPTLWDLVRESGGRSANMGWPAGVGAPVDWNVPEIWPLEEGVDPVETIRRHASPEGLLSEIEREATGRLTKDNFTIDHMTRDDRAGAAAAYLLERYRPRLLTVHIIETDHFQHLDGRQGDRVRRAVGAADRAVGQIREAAARAGILERTAFVVTGDHGFVDTHTALAPNVWLREAGLRESRRAGENWRATFHTSGGAAFLRVRDPEDRQAVERARRILEGLPRGVRGTFRILERAELDRLGADPSAPFALAAEPGIQFASDGSGPALRRADGAGHGHHPEVRQLHTGFVAWGAGVRPGASIHRMELVDVGPFVAALLGLSLDAPDGVLPRGLLEAEGARGERTGG